MTLPISGETGFHYEMTDSRESQATGRQVFAPLHERLPLTLSAIRRRLKLLQMLVPAGLLLLVVVYEVGPARWLHDSLSAGSYFIAEILVYGTVGPMLAFVLLEFLGRWLEERETNELQAQVLAQARERARLNHKLSDDAVQALFAASALIASLESRLPDLSPQAAAQLREAKQALDQAIQQLRTYLLIEPPPEE
jgi:signal transduction histidine kinase